MREFLDEGVVREYALLYKDNTNFPPLVAFFDGQRFWLADGFHRYAAAARADLSELPFIVKEGSRRDAILFAAGANKGHGLRLGYGDKRRVIERLLLDEEWGKWSDGAIARHVGAAQAYASKVRRDLAEAKGVTFPTKRMTVHAPTGKAIEKETKNTGHKPGSRGYVREWLYYLVNFTPQQFVMWQSIVKGRTDKTILAEAVEVVMVESERAQPAA